MDFKVENQGTQTYLVYELGSDEKLDTMSLGMLTNNDIPGFVSTTFMQIDTERYVKYNVSAKVSAKQILSGPVNKKRLIGLFSSVVKALMAAEDYMLEPTEILLDPEHIFADVTTCEAELVCLPVVQDGKPPQDIEMFFKNILFNTQFDQTENSSHVAELINYLNGTPGLDLPQFKELLDKMGKTEEAKKAPLKPQSEPSPKEEPKKKERFEEKPISVLKPEPLRMKPADIKQPDVVETVIPSVEAGDVEKPKKKGLFGKLKKEVADEKPAGKKNSTGGYPFMGIEIPGQPAVPKPEVPAKLEAETVKPQPVAKLAPQPMVSKPAPQPAPTPAPQPVQPQPVATPINFGETTVLGGGTVGETTVLGAPAQAARVAMPYLIRAKNNEKIPLNKPVFRVGKEKSYVDYFIGDNTAISRSHANFYTNEGEYFVEDTNSTNHTFVNGKMIPSGMKFKISSGDTIRLANEDFTFSVE